MSSPSDLITEALAPLKAQGWHIEVVPPSPKDPDRTVSYRSPRMWSNALLTVDSHAADVLALILRDEAEQCAYLNHDATITVALNGVKADLLAQLATVYYANGQGKGLPVPSEVTLKELVIPLSLPTRAETRAPS